MTATGGASPNYGTGRIERNGYVMVWAGKRYRYEHRLVMERHLGRPLSRREVVHHINGDKHDNRLDNLEIMSISEHRRHHGSPWSKGRPRLDLRLPDVPCPVCGRPFKPKRIRGKRQQTCSVACSHIHRPNAERHRTTAAGCGA